MCKQTTTVHHCVRCSRQFFINRTACSTPQNQRASRQKCDTIELAMVEDYSEKLCGSCAAYGPPAPVNLQPRAVDPVSPETRPGSALRDIVDEFGPYSGFSPYTAPYVNAQLDRFQKRHPERKAEDEAGPGDLMVAMSGLDIDERSKPSVTADLMTATSGLGNGISSSKWALDEDEWTLQERKVSHPSFAHQMSRTSDEPGYDPNDIEAGAEAAIMRAKWALDEDHPVLTESRWELSDENKGERLTIT